jgi:GDP-D-mannose dehydratase
MLDTLIGQSTVAKIDVLMDPDRLRPIDADLQVPDTRKFEAHTGWKPEISYEKTMRDLLDYWRDRVRSDDAFLTR